MEYKETFGEWCEKTGHTDFLDRWDYEKNEYSPYEVSSVTSGQYWFKCPRGIHESELHKIIGLKNMANPLLRCSKCRSFAQYIIDEFGEDYLLFVWSDKNTTSPWDYNKTARDRVYFNCENNPNHVYDMCLSNFANGQRCPYCAGKRVLKEESVGYLYPDSVKYWSDKNEGTPFDYLPNSTRRFWWKCPNGKHEDFERTVQGSVRYDFRCGECAKEKNRELGARNRSDLVGQTFGHLVVTRYAYTKNNRAYWYCDCDCGAKDIVFSSDILNQGKATTCKNKAIHFSGENSPNWKGGISQTEANKIRASMDYKGWRNTVLGYDNHKCVACGCETNLEAHHIFQFANYKDLRTNPINGITLCNRHHSLYVEGSFHREYGTRNATADDLQEYVNAVRASEGIAEYFDVAEYLNEKQELYGYDDKIQELIINKEENE